MPVPAFVNPGAGSASDALAVLRADARFAVRETPPEALAEALRAEVEDGTPRLLVAGGDGTLASAASALAGRGTELAVFPGGTLNHFAGRLGLPAEPQAVLDLAAGGAARPVDLGRLNGRPFLNTSSVGAYVPFVRLRERLEDERGRGYWLASTLAAARSFARFPTYRLAVRAEGEVGVYHTPLLFVAVNAQELPVPGPSAATDEARRGLRLTVLRRPTRLGLLRTLAFGVLRGPTALLRSEHVDSRLVDRFEVNSVHGHAHAAIDGELVRLATPLRYRFERDALRVVTPDGT